LIVAGFVTVTVDGQAVAPLEDVQDAWVTLEWGDEVRCEACGSELAEYDDGWHDEDDGLTCSEAPRSETCEACEGEGYPDDEDGDPSECEACEGHGEAPGLHVPGYGIPGNGASIRVQPDSVQVAISVADPRGGFQMEVRRRPDGGYWLHVPYAGEPMEHARMVLDHPGTYRVG
jgi:hypothetical protein